MSGQLRQRRAQQEYRRSSRFCAVCDRSVENPFANYRSEESRLIGISRNLGESIPSSDCHHPVGGGLLEKANDCQTSWLPAKVIDCNRERRADLDSGPQLSSMKNQENLKVKAV